MDNSTVNLPPDNEPSIGVQAPGADRVRWLRAQIAELRKRWPPHSAPPSLLMRLDDLEEELADELRKRGSAGGS